MKRETVYAILATDENGNDVIFAKGTRKEIETLYREIIPEDRHTARTVKTEKGIFTIYGYGSKRTARPDKIKPVHFYNSLLSSLLIKL